MFTPEEIKKLHDFHVKFYGGKWGKPKSIPYLLMKLSDTIYSYKRALPCEEHYVIWTAGSGYVKAGEIKDFVHIICKAIVKQASKKENLTHNFWESSRRDCYFGKTHCKQTYKYRYHLPLFKAWWEVFRTVAENNEAFIPPLPKQHPGLMDHPPIRFR